VAVRRRRSRGSVEQSHLEALAKIGAACGNSSQTGAVASATPSPISVFLRSFALPPFVLSLEASPIEQAC